MQIFDKQNSFKKNRFLVHTCKKKNYLDCVRGLKSRVSGSIKDKEDKVIYRKILYENETKNTEKHCKNKHVSGQKRPKSIYADLFFRLFSPGKFVMSFGITQF